MKTKLNWKKKWLDDKSGYWYSAKVPVIGWEYIVDNCDYSKEYTASIFYAENDSDTHYITNKKHKSEKAAMNACEKHLEKTFNKFKKWINSK